MADVLIAAAYVLKNEDRRRTGKVTTDEGGKTRFGVAQKFHPQLDEAFYTMPVDQAYEMAREIYANEYAAPIKLKLFASQPVANKVLDLAVNAGNTAAAEILQTAIVAAGTIIVVDKKIGPATVAALNSCDQGKIMDQLIVLSEAFYRKVALRNASPAYELASWLARAAQPGI